MFKSVIILTFGAWFATAIPAAKLPADWKTFSNVTVFTPPASWSSHSTSYGRTLILNQNCETDDVLLSTFTFTPPGLNYLPVMQSKDGGNTWKEISQIYFQQTLDTAGGSVSEPSLYELPIKIGKYPAGTILASANAIPANYNSTNIEVHASTDKGISWEYVSTVVSSGPPNTANGAPCVWEPFIHSYNGEAVVHFSDQSDPKYGQKLAHRTSKDLKTWSKTVNDVTFDDYDLRPGMITTAEMGNGKWICTYEVGNFPALPASPYGVHYTIADSPLDFGKNTPKLLQAANSKTIPSASPFVQWTPVGGSKGTVVVSDGSYGQLFLNTEYGAAGQWEEVDSGHGIGYSRSLRVMPNEDLILVFNGGMYGDSNTIVTAGEFKVPGAKSTKDTISSCNGKSKLGQKR